VHFNIVIYKYDSYLKIRHLISDKIKLPFDIFDNFQGMIEKGNFLFFCDLYENRINQDIYEENKRNQWMEYSSKDFNVETAKSVQEIIEESEFHHNCLWKYIPSICRGETVVLFFRKIGQTRSEVICEVFERKMIQAKSRFNSIPNIERKKWIEEYSEVLSIDCTHCTDLLERDDEY